MRRSENVFLHWVSPVLGFLIIGFVLWNADASAKIGGVIWLGVGALVLLYYSRKGTGVLPEHAADPFTPPTPTATSGGQGVSEHLLGRRTRARASSAPTASPCSG